MALLSNVLDLLSGDIYYRTLWGNSVTGQSGHIKRLDLLTVDLISGFHCIILWRKGNIVFLSNAASAICIIGPIPGAKEGTPKLPFVATAVSNLKLHNAQVGTKTAACCADVLGIPVLVLPVICSFFSLRVN